jgi:hypothetical protein
LKEEKTEMMFENGRETEMVERWRGGEVERWGDEISMML